MGHFGVPYPKGAPAVKDVFKEETGIELEIVSLEPLTLAVAPQEEEDWGE